jgi:acetolactate synthase I/II/III large subunit
VGGTGKRTRVNGGTGEHRYRGDPDVRTAAAELVTVLQDEGIGHLFVNPGMYTAPLRAALADADAAGLAHPQAVLCVHEHVALSAAHGHHLVSGDPQAVMVHVQSGDLKLEGVAEHAQRSRIPVTVFYGSGGGWTGTLREPPTLPPQLVSEPGLLTTTSKWAADLTCAGDPGMLVRRALQIARTEPAGLSRVALPIELLGMAAGPPSRRLPPPRPPAPDLSALDEMASLLATAEWPLIIAGRVGRHVGSVQHLARLAEALGAPVVDIRNNVNLPGDHSLYAGRDAQDMLDRADAILLLDVDVPCVPGLGPPPEGAWLLQIDVDCIKAEWPGWTYPVEVAITADTEVALPQLLTLLGDRLIARRRRVQDRRVRIERTLRRIHDSWRERALSRAPEDRADAIVAELNRWLPEDAVVVEEVIYGCGSSIRQLHRQPGHLFRGRGSSPGWSIDAALGAQLGRRAQPVVALCDDAAFAAALPSAAFWSAHRAGAPFLTVVLDRRVSGPGADGEQDVAAIARAGGAEVAVVSSPGQVAETLERLLTATRDGACTVMDVRLPAVQAGEEARPAVARRNPLTTSSTVTKREPA